MEKSKLKNVWPYQQDNMNLPVHDLAAALPFYETILEFQVVSKNDQPHKFAALEKDGVQIGLAENGGNPSLEGCFFEVDNVEAAFAELRSNGLIREPCEFETQKHGATNWKVFFVVAPDGLCYCYGQRQP